MVDLGGMPHCTGPGAEEPFDPHDVDDVRERVVVPVVSSLIRAQDLERIDVGWGPREPVLGFWNDPPLPPSDAPYTSRITFRDAAERPTALRADDELWVLVRALGATWHSRLWQPETAWATETMGKAAHALADQLEDWVCELVYWGEQALAKVIIPARRAASG
jgi:hypothetical protein